MSDSSMLVSPMFSESSNSLVAASSDSAIAGNPTTMVWSNASASESSVNVFTEASAVSFMDVIESATDSPDEPRRISWPAVR